MKQKAEFTVRLDDTLYRKALIAAERSGCNLNNYMLHLIRTNIAYIERTHGRIDPAKAKLPPEEGEE